MIKIFMTAFLFTASGCVGQAPAVKEISDQASKENLKNNLYFLASDKLEGRLMGSAGDTLASVFIADWFKKQGLIPPYANGTSYLQAITATRLDDSSILEFSSITYKKFESWVISPSESFDFQQLPVYLADFATFDEWSKALPGLNLNGSAVIINTSLLNDGERLDTLEKILKQQGVKLIIWSGPRAKSVIQRSKHGAVFPKYKMPPAFTSLPVVTELVMTTTLLQQLLVGDGISIDTNGTYTKQRSDPVLKLTKKINLKHVRTEVQVHAPNVIGIIKGSDANAGCVVISAHHDHDGRDGNIIYYGAVDNASGSVAVMEVARLMSIAAKSGLRPKRSIVFASFTGEERGLLGSFYYVANPLFPMAKTHAVLNIDMLGRVDTIHHNNHMPDTNYAYILVKDSSNRGLRQALYQANESVKLTLDKHYEDPQFSKRRILGSDQYPFYEKGVPFIRIDCGFTQDYHKPTDTADKIDYDLLTTQTKLVFLTMWNLANN